jgi:hypothetical protein
MSAHAGRTAALVAGLACVVTLAVGGRLGGQVTGTFERDVAVPMRDGVVLRADVARPGDGGPFPTLVYRTPYGKGGTSSSPIVRKAVDRGYAVVVQDVRGRYASGGEFRPYQQEGADGFDTIEWAAVQPWSNGKVGTFGLSYPGAVQWLAAVESPPHLVAMVPAMTFATPNHFWYTNGVWDGSWLLWTWLNIAPDLRQRRNLPGPRTYEEALASWKTAGITARGTFPLADLPAFKGVADWYYEWMRHPPYDPWWQWAELSDKYARVSAAVLNISGWHDEMYGPAGATMNFAGLVAARGGEARTARTQVVIGPWTHGSDWETTRIGAREMGPAAALDYDTLVLDWLDRHVKGAANGVDAQAPVRYYMMGAGEWRAAEAWPPPAERRSLYLGGTPLPGRASGRLGWAAPARAGQASFFSDAARPVRDPYDAEAGAFDYSALSARPDVIAFDLSLPAEPLELAGPITAELFVSVDTPDTDLWVKVLDHGFNVMSTGLDVIRTSYRNRRPERELLQPGTIYRLEVPTLMTANRFTRQLRVLVMASFAPNMSHNLQTGRLEFDSAEMARAKIIVHMGGQHASRLVVPVAAR